MSHASSEPSPLPSPTQVVASPAQYPANSAHSPSLRLTQAAGGGRQRDPAHEHPISSTYKPRVAVLRANIWM